MESIETSGKKISRLVYTRDGKRVSIFMDDQFELSVEEKLVVDFQLYQGKVLEDEVIAELVENDFSERLKRKAIEKISMSLRSTNEIRQYLKRIANKILLRIKIPFDFEISVVVDKIILDLVERKYLDDRGYANSLVDIYQRTKSKIEIQKLLVRKGISRAIVDAVLSNSVDDPDLISQLIDKKRKLIKFKNLGKAEEKKKIIEFLMRKGYHYDEIKDLVE